MTENSKSEVRRPRDSVYFIRDKDHGKTKDKGNKMRKKNRKGVTSGFHRDVNKACALLGFYAAYNGNSVPTFRDKLLVLSARVKQVEVFNLQENKT